MTQNETDQTGNASSETDQLLSCLYDLLVKSKPSVSAPLPQNIAAHPQFQAICAQIEDLRTLSVSLSKGNLNENVSNRGFVLSNLKSVQSNMRHLLWKTHRIAEGDYSQTVDFLGDFSDSFNEMTQNLLSTTTQLMDLANLDALTKIPNRLALNRFLSEAFHDSEDGPGNLCVLMMDIDYFKSVNDTYGHRVGDEVLRAVVNRIQAQTRQNDCVARYGGEEFTLVLPNTDLSVAVKVCERILALVRQDPVLCEGGLKVPVTLSIGVSQRLPQDTVYEEIIARSDAALYAAKNAGRDCYRVFDPDMPAE